MTPSCFVRKQRRAAKQHRCCECRGLIQAGEMYLYISGVWDGTPASFRTCCDCSKLRDDVCVGMAYDELPALGELGRELEADDRRRFQEIVEKRNSAEETACVS